MKTVNLGAILENMGYNTGRRGSDVVTVRAADAEDHVFEVTASWVNISEFTVTGAKDKSKAGIYLNNANHCNIFDNNASNNSDGISLWFSSNNTLQNMMSGNTWNFDVFGGSLSDYSQNIDTSNMVDGKTIYYWVDQQDTQIPCDAGFVGVVNSTNITVKDLTLTNNTQGILFAYTDNSRIENVSVSNSRDGIWLYSSSNNTLQSNTASNNNYGIVPWDLSNNTLTNNTVSNNGCGIYMRYSSVNTLTNNNALNNWFGIGLYYSNNNTLYHNNLINNTLYHNNLINNTGHNAYDTDTNTWDSGSAGN